MSSRPRTSDAGALALATVLALAAPGHAQDVVEVVPGEVVTFVPAFPVPAGAAGRLGWRWETPDAVRRFGPEAGTSPIPASGPMQIPFTFAVDRDHPAGSRPAGRVVVTWPDGSTAARAVVLDVRAVRSLELELPSDARPVEPGREAVLELEVSNRGNAVDSIAFAVDLPPGYASSVELDDPTVGAGGRASGRLRIRVPHDARIGTRARVTVEAEGIGSHARAGADLYVVRPRGPLAGLRNVPATVFLGSGSNPIDASAITVAAIRASGAAGPETSVSLRARTNDELGVPTAFRRRLAGPELRLDVRRPTWRAAIGDVGAATRAGAGAWIAGRGVDVAWDRGAWFAEALAARPSTGLDAPLDGHASLAAVGREIGSGRVTAIVSDAKRSLGRGATGSRATIGAVRYALESRRDRELRAEIGWARVEAPDGRATAGLAASAEGTLRGDRGSIAATLRRVPATAPGVSMHGDEAYLGGRWHATTALDVVGWGALHRVPDVDGRARARSRSAGASLRARSAAIRGELGVETHATRALGDEHVQRAIHAGVSAPVGPVRLDVRAETGTGRIGDRTHRGWSALARAAWSSERGRLVLEAGRDRDDPRFDRTHLDLRGTLEAGAARLEGAVRWQAIADRAWWRGWTSAAIDVGAGLSVVGGLEYEPFGRDAPWGVSIGLEKRLALPLPLPRGAVVRGIAFEDHDGDGRRDPGEPGVADLVLRAGPVSTETGLDGRFEIRDEIARGQLVEVDPSRLDSGLRLATPGPFRARGELALALSRTSTIEVVGFRDLDGDRSPDEAEPPVEGARVMATGPDGARRYGTTDGDGRVRLVVPGAGRWSVRITTPESRFERVVEAEVEIDVPYGEDVSRPVPLPRGRREIRFTARSGTTGPALPSP